MSSKISEFELLLFIFLVIVIATGIGLAIYGYVSDQKEEKAKVHHEQAVVTQKIEQTVIDRNTSWGIDHEETVYYVYLDGQEYKASSAFYKQMEVGDKVNVVTLRDQILKLVIERVE